jgi:membrane protease YdiL (CAAX protease family)
MKCPKCETENTKAHPFCGKCGTKLIARPEDNYHVAVRNTKVFFFILLGYIALLNFAKFKSNYITSLITDLIFAGIVITFFLLNYKVLIAFIRPKVSNVKLLIILCVSFPAFAFIITHFADFLNQSSFNSNNSSYYEHYSDSPFPLLFCIISIGVFPAIFEEIAFRGILFNELKNIMSVNATIILTTILFTILHFSFISFLWIFPIGLLFGYLRSKYNTLIYGIIGHFIYNTSIVLIQYFNL